jgi:hypothetical protein
MSFDSPNIIITLGPASGVFAHTTNGASAAVAVAAPMTTISVAEIHAHGQPQSQPLVGLEGFTITAMLTMFALATQICRRIPGWSGPARNVP